MKSGRSCLGGFLGQSAESTEGEKPAKRESYMGGFTKRELLRESYGGRYKEILTDGGLLRDNY